MSSGFMKVLEEIGADKQKNLDEIESLRARCASQERLTAKAVVEATVAEKQLKEATALLARPCPWCLCTRDRSPAQLAAPESSTELVELRAWVAKAEAMTADLDPPDMLVHWVQDRQRAESAEAQLAISDAELLMARAGLHGANKMFYAEVAVRKSAEAQLSAVAELAVVARMTGCDSVSIARLERLLTAPSHGEGEETP